MAFCGEREIERISMKVFLNCLTIQISYLILKLFFLGDVILPQKLLGCFILNGQET